MAVNSPLAQAIQASGLSNRRLDELCQRHGITRPVLERYARGGARPAPWLAVEIAAMFASTPGALFPEVSR